MLVFVNKIILHQIGFGSEEYPLFLAFFRSYSTLFIYTSFPFIAFTPHPSNTINIATIITIIPTEIIFPVFPSSYFDLEWSSIG